MARSASQNVSTQSAASILTRMKKTNARVLSSSLLTHAPDLEPKATTATTSTATTSPNAAKLPHKLRQHVSRLRSQFALVGSPSLSSPFGSKGGSGGSASMAHMTNSSGGSFSPSSQTSYRALVTTATATSPVTTSPNEPKYSSQSQKMQTLQAQLSLLKMSTRSMVPGSEPPFHTSEKEHEPLLGSPEDPVRFFDLLRPLQNSLSCASLMSEWTSEDEADEAGDAAAHPFDLLQQQQQQTLSQPERERSHMLRICCSVDNLLLSIGSQVQQEKRDEAITRGAARELLLLFQFAIQQVATAASTLMTGPPSFDHTLGNNRSMASEGDTASKELQYMQEFIVEVAERMGKLDHFVRTTLLSEIDELRAQLARTEREVADLKQTNVQLQTEMNDLRDFHSQNSLSGLGYAGSSTSASAIGGGEAELQCRGDTNDRRISKLFSVAQTSHPKALTSEHDELQQLRNQCAEFARLLEMAKQEIRLCHRERDVQSGKIAELSSATFKDEELLALRNQLQSEKRRVKNLEIENVAMRETEIDQTMKIHSLMVNGVNSSNNGSTLSAQNQLEGDGVGHHQRGARGTDAAVAQASHRGNGSVSTGSSAKSSLLVAAADTQSTSGAQLDNFITRQTSGTPPSSPKRRENAADHAAESESSPPSARWFYDSIGLHVNENAPRKRQQSTPDTPEPGSSVADLKQFLSSHAVTDKQLAVAQVQSKVRRQGSVPTISLQQSTSEVSRTQSDSNGRVRSAGVSRQTKPGSTDDGDSGVDQQDMVATCSQLICVFYQRFLMAEEARVLIPAAHAMASCSASAQETASLASIVLRFFLERTPVRDGDALLDAAQFVRCLQRMKSVSADARFFCEFLDGTRSRDELSFFLWVLQAIEETKVGISYETPAASTMSEASAVMTAAPHICALKATFLTRIIYRLFHVSAAKRPSSAPAPPTNRPLSAAAAPLRTLSRSSPSKKDLTSPSPRPSSSPRKKRKSRGSDVEVLQLMTNPSPAGAVTAMDEQTEVLSALDRAVESFRAAVAQNSGAPLTLEAFNVLLLRFTVTPTPEELRLRLGPFFRPTGDEKKLSLSVYLALIQEVFAHQLEWRKKRMRNLFVSLAQQQEADDLARQQKLRVQADAAAEAAGASKSRRASQAKKPTSAAPAHAVQKKKPKKKKKSHRDLRDDSNKYLTGLSRALLRQFVLHAGIVSDVLHVDVDELFVAILERSRQSAKDIHFDEIYDALERMNWLGNRDLRVDPTTVVFSQQWQAAENDARAKMVARLREVWSVHARQSLALCENDLNVFVRRRAQHLADAITHRLAASNVVETPTSDHFWWSLQSIRDFLALAWRVASKRTGERQTDRTKEIVGRTNQRDDGTPIAAAPQWFLTEFYLVNQAIEVVAADFAGYAQPPRPRLLSGDAHEAHTSRFIEDAEMARSDLRCFWDTRAMPLADVLQNHTRRQSASRETHPKDHDEDEALVQELELVLKRFSYYLVHLFAVCTSAAFNCEGLTLPSWLKLAREFRRVDKQLPGAKVARGLFLQVYSAGDAETAGRRPHDVWLTRSQFTALLVRLAIAKAQACLEKRLKLLPASLRSSTVSALDRPAQIVSDFCYRVVVPSAFQPRERLHERDFVGKLSCPLVTRALLEHRAFLRSVFFYYAKQDADASEECPQSGDDSSGDDASALQLSKTKRNSMNFDEFLGFLDAFELLDRDDATRGSMAHRMNRENAQLVFRRVMALENDDTTQMEFEEFAAAIAALAVFLDPSPFQLWHAKIDAFVATLERIAGRQHVRFDCPFT